MLPSTYEHIPRDELTLQITLFKTTTVNETITNYLDLSTLKYLLEVID